MDYPQRSPCVNSRLLTANRHVYMFRIAQRTPKIEPASQHVLSDPPVEPTHFEFTSAQESRHETVSARAAHAHSTDSATTSHFQLASKAASAAPGPATPGPAIPAGPELAAA